MPSNEAAYILVLVVHWNLGGTNTFFSSSQSLIKQSFQEAEA